VIGPGAARLLLAGSLLPFSWYAIRDQILHVTVRKVSIAENVIHALLAVFLTVVIVRAFLFQTKWMAIALLLFVVTGAVDEYVFHRRIPESEHDVHAKEHFALLFFVAVFAGIVWVG
jgi:hypothetical protein